MANTRSNPVDEMFERIAYELAVYLKFVKQDEFDSVLVAALDEYHSRSKKFALSALIYRYTRQRGITIQKNRDEIIHPDTNATSDAKKIHSLSELAQKIFSKGKWYAESFNTIFMRRLIENMESWGLTLHEKMSHYHIDRHQSYLTIKKHLIENIEALRNVDAVTTAEEKAEKLKQLEEELNRKNAEIENEKQALSIARQKLLEEMAELRVKKQETAEEFDHAKRIVAGFETMTPQVNEAVLRVMRFAGLDYMAELTKLKTKQEEIEKVCAASSETRNKRAEDQAKYAEFLEKKRKEKAEEIFRLCQQEIPVEEKEKAEKIKQTKKETEVVKNVESPEKMTKFRAYSLFLQQAFEKKAELYSQNQCAAIPNQADYSNGLEREMGADEKPVAKVKKDFNALFPGLVKSIGNHPNAQLTKPSVQQAAQPKEEVAPVEKKPTIITVKVYQDMLTQDGQKISVPVPPPPPNRKPPAIPAADVLPPVDSLGPPPEPPMMKCSSLLFAHTNTIYKEPSVALEEMKALGILGRGS